MDAPTLIAPQSPIGYPAPFWFIELFKVLGFALHAIPMSLWYAGTILAVLLTTFGRGNAKTVGCHIVRSLPFAVAIGVNLGIIPLLFIQSAYYQFFYPATILMAWPWFAVFWMVIIAYTSVYIYRLAVEGRMPEWIGGLAGLVASIIFIAVGFIFANALSLMTNPNGWWSIFRKSNSAGAAIGLALNDADPTLIPRWLFMFGLAITTTAAFIVFDAVFLSGRENRDYRRYAVKFGFELYSVGIVWVVVLGSWYIFGTRRWEFLALRSSPIAQAIFWLAAMSPGLPYILIAIQKFILATGKTAIEKEPSRVFAALIAAAQFGVVVLNAVSRQWLQNRELAPYTRVADCPVDLQTSAITAFLVVFAVGAAAAVWMVYKIIQVNRREFDRSN